MNEIKHNKIESPVLSQEKEPNGISRRNILKMFAGGFMAAIASGKGAEVAHALEKFSADAGKETDNEKPPRISFVFFILRMRPVPT